jgi:hypothetical protein
MILNIPRESGHTLTVVYSCRVDVEILGNPTGTGRAYLAHHRPVFTSLWLSYKITCGTGTYNVPGKKFRN